MNILKSVGLIGEPCGTTLVISSNLVELDPREFMHLTVRNGIIWRNIPFGSFSRRMLMGLSSGTLP